MSDYDLRNMTKVELHRNWLGQLFVDTEPSQVGGTNQWLRLETIDKDGKRTPVCIAEPEALPSEKTDGGETVTMPSSE